MAILKAKDLDRNSWKALIDNLPAPDGTCMIIETIEKLRFEVFDAKGIPFESCIRGRIFHPEGELRWRLIDGHYRTVFLGNADWIGDILIDAPSELKELNPQVCNMILWGRRRDMEDEWIEQAVPHRFHYPLEGGNISQGRLKLITENWYDSFGRLVFSRFKNLEETEGVYASR